LEIGPVGSSITPADQANLATLDAQAKAATHQTQAIQKQQPTPRFAVYGTYSDQEVLWESQLALAKADRIQANGVSLASRTSTFAAIFADHDRRMEETARMTTKSLHAGKSDREVLLETRLAIERDKRIRKQAAKAGTGPPS